MSRLCIFFAAVLSLLSASSAQFSVTTIRSIVQCTDCASPCLDVLVPIYPDFSNEGMLISDVGALAAAACAGPYKFQSISATGSTLFNNSDPAALVLMDSTIIWDTTLQPTSADGADEDAPLMLLDRPAEASATKRMRMQKRMLLPKRSTLFPSAATAVSAPGALSAPANSCTFSRYVPCTLVLQLYCVWVYNSPVQPTPVQLTPTMPVSDVVALLAARCGETWQNVTIILTYELLYTPDNNRLAADVFRSGDTVKGP